MPTYEYACRDCGEHVEVVQSFKEDPLTECGLCSGQLRKVFSAAGIIFKGSGYYVTDSRKASADAKSSGSGDAKSAADKTSDSSSASSESKAKSA
jgi:putative FmdB family regulatory protein